MQIILEVPEKRYIFFKALMRSLSFPKIVSVTYIFRRRRKYGINMPKFDKEFHAKKHKRQQS